MITRSHGTSGRDYIEHEIHASDTGRRTVALRHTAAWGEVSLRIERPAWDEGDEVFLTAEELDDLALAARRMAGRLRR
jgi:hypothetical protein